MMMNMMKLRMMIKITEKICARNVINLVENVQVIYKKIKKNILGGSSNECTECNSEIHHRIVDNNICICSDNYYDNGEIIC